VRCSSFTDNFIASSQLLLSMGFKDSLFNMDTPFEYRREPRSFWAIKTFFPHIYTLKIPIPFA